MHVNRRNKLENDVHDKSIALKYDALIKALGHEAVRNGIYLNRALIGPE
jgi:hypothetical protein